jgi:hypothetical protein
MALAFERFWQVILQQQVAFRTLARAMTCLRASLNGALGDMLRAYSGPGVSDFEDRTGNLQVWVILQRMLPSVREQRMAYLLYHCGLGPQEIVQVYPQEWKDVQEVYCLRRSILERLLQNTDQLP